VTVLLEYLDPMTVLLEYLDPIDTVLVGDRVWNINTVKQKLGPETFYTFTL